MSRPPFVAPPGGMRARRLPTRRGEFAVLEALPDGRPAGVVLCVPGYTGSKEDFIALLAPLAEAGHRVVAVDGRGQYETPGPAGGTAYRLGALAEDVRALTAALGASAPVHLVGHSLGGLVCRGAVLRDPGPYASLTLMSSGPAQIARWQRWRVRALCHGLPLLGQRAVWRLWHPVAERGEVDHFMRRRWLASRPAQLRATGRTLRWEPDRVARLAACRLPVHVLSGERDAAWPVPLLDAMAARLDAHRTVIKGAEHSPNVEQPEATAGALLDFWRGLAAPAAPAVSR